MKRCVPLGAALVIAAFSTPALAHAADVDRACSGKLRATALGSLQPGGTGRLAVSWSGPEATLVQAWLDMDGDGGRDPSEQLLSRRVEGGVAVLEFPVPDMPVPGPPGLNLKLGLETPAADRCELMVKVVAREETTAGWQEGFFVSDLDDGPGSFVVYDDGGGPDLYVGGDFVMAGGQPVNGIARWDGSVWSSVGSGAAVTGSDDNARVWSLAVYDDGGGAELYAAGHFETMDGIPAASIARWDGSSWSALGAGLINLPSQAGDVVAMVVHDDGGGAKLYVGGYFEEAGGVAVSHIASWNGSAWAPLALGVEANVYALAVFDDGGGPDLYAGGWFTTASGVPVNYVARWDGAAWSSLGIGTSGMVRALEVFDDGGGADLYAGGYFATAGGGPAVGIARWDGAAWSAVGGGIDEGVGVLEVFDDGTGSALYAGGSFSTAGGVPAENIARWDGASWSALGVGAGGGVATLVATDLGGGPALYVGGRYSRCGGIVANHIARWSGGDWSQLSPPAGLGIARGQIRVMEVFDDGGGADLYVGGGFDTAGAIAANSIARWDGTSWSALGDGIDGSVHALEVFDDGGGTDLYVGGSFSTAGGVPAQNIARWDGAAWSSLGSGVDGWVNALEVFDDGGGPCLWAGGTFTTAGGFSAARVACWDGTVWGAAGSGINDQVRALKTYDDGSGPALYAAGYFTIAGGVFASNIARWDGATWSEPGGGIGSAGVYALEVFDDGTGSALFVGGRFDTAGGGAANRIARWDGSSWQTLSGPQGNGMTGYNITAIAGYSSDRQSLYVGGQNIYAAGGVPSSRIGQWLSGGIFTNGFESGDTTAWSVTVGVQ